MFGRSQKSGLKVPPAVIRGFLPVFLPLLLTLSGCAGIPERPAEWTPAEMLPESCSVILSVRVTGNEELVFGVGDYTGNGELLRKGFGETEYFYLGLEPKEDLSGFGVYASGRGFYPRSAAGTALSFSSEWKRRKDRYLWYTNAETGMQVSFPEPGIFCMTTVDIDRMFTRLSETTSHLPGEITAAMARGDITLYIPSFDPSLAGAFLPEVKTFPAEMLLLILEGDGDGYRMSLKIRTPDEKSARSLVSALKLVILAREKKKSDFSISDFMKNILLQTEGNLVIVEGLYFEDAELMAFAERVIGSGGE